MLRKSIQEDQKEKKMMEMKLETVSSLFKSKENYNINVMGVQGKINSFENSMGLHGGKHLQKTKGRHQQI